MVRSRIWFFVRSWMSSRRKSGSRSISCRARQVSKGPATRLAAESRRIARHRNGRRVGASAASSCAPLCGPSEQLVATPDSRSVQRRSFGKEQAQVQQLDSRS